MKLLAAAALALLSWSALAQEPYPSKPIRILVGYAAGGGNDIIVRVMLPELQKGLGQPVIVENKPGAQSIVAAELAARAPADGYTLFMGPSGPMTINPATYSKLPYSPLRDFAPISLICEFPLLVTVDAKLPVKNVKELITLLKANPGKYSYASAGLGTPSHLLGEQFRVTHNLDVVHVPYGGSGPAITAGISGHTPIVFAAMSAAAPQASAGKLRVLAVMSEKPSSSAPDVPTIGAAGFPGMEGEGWVGALAPMGTPKEIVALLNKQINEIITLPESKEKFAQLGLDIVGGTAEAFAKQMRAEGEKWAKLIKTANIKAK